MLDHHGLYLMDLPPHEDIVLDSLVLNRGASPAKWRFAASTGPRTSAPPSHSNPTSGTYSRARRSCPWMWTAWSAPAKSRSKPQQVSPHCILPLSQGRKYALHLTSIACCCKDVVSEHGSCKHGCIVKALQMSSLCKHQISIVRCKMVTS